MNIKKVDDKPMVIHTKEKTKLHIKQEPEAKIKGRNVLVVDKGPKITGTDKEDKTVIKKSSAKETVKNSMQKEKGVYAQVQRAKQDREKAIRNRLMLFNSGIMGSCIVCVWCRNVDFNTSTQGISRTLSV